MPNTEVIEIREINDFHDFYQIDNFNYKCDKKSMNVNSYDICSKTYKYIETNNIFICDDEEIKSKKIIASFIISSNIYIFLNVKTKCEKKNNFLYVLVGKNDSEKIKTMKIQMYFNIYESARQDELCRHLSNNLNLCQIQYDIQSSKFILLFESDNKTLMASLDYLLSIHSVSTDLNFLKYNGNLLCINSKPLMFCVSKKNEYKIIVIGCEKKIKKMYAVICG